MRRKATREQLYWACHFEGLSPQAMADRFGYANIWTLWKAFKHQDIPWPHTLIGTTQLSPRQRQIITGTILGDAYVAPGGNHYYLRIRHCEAQRSFVEWKEQELQPFARKSGIQVYEPQGLQRQRVYEFGTYTHKEFDYYRKLFYPEGKKVVTPDVLAGVGDLALAVWIMDDGSYDPSRGYIKLATCSFTHTEHELMQAWFAAHYNITPMIHKVTGGYYTLVFSWRDTQLLIPRLYHHVLPCLRYKLGF